MAQRNGSSHSFQSFTHPTNRFGPTASFSSSTTSLTNTADPLVDNPSYSGLPNGMDDDDDLDDHLHTFTAAEKKDLSSPFVITSWRGWANALTLAFLACAVVGLFAVYPIATYYVELNASSGSLRSGYNLGGINATGQVPSITGLPTMIDADTPSDVYTRTGFDGETWTLTFSDEFNKDGRTFFNGDDPFFEAVDLHYWPTGWVRSLQSRAALTILQRFRVVRPVRDHHQGRPPRHLAHARTDPRPQLQVGHAPVLEQAVLQQERVLRGQRESARDKFCRGILAGCLGDGQFGQAGLWCFHRR